jgi:hypothetical protein
VDESEDSNVWYVLNQNKHERTKRDARSIDTGLLTVCMNEEPKAQLRQAFQAAKRSFLVLLHFRGGQEFAWLHMYGPLM